MHDTANDEQANKNGARAPRLASPRNKKKPLRLRYSRRVVEGLQKTRVGPLVLHRVHGVVAQHRGASHRRGPCRRAGRRSHAGSLLATEVKGQKRSAHRQAGSTKGARR